MFTLDLPIFQKRNSISDEAWEQSGCTWDQLTEIAVHYETRKAALTNTAEFLVKAIQQLPEVHSVRWRIKDTEHVLEKIVRKRIEGSKKYLTINRENYSEKITDLIGLRALHLFKMDCYSIDSAVRNLWKPHEKPTIYVREGDQPMPDQFLAGGFGVKKHPAGYRSIHYVLSSQPMQECVKFELQVRTIFEEGWSEIDHRIRYPNFSDNPLVSYFLTIFNRMAGSADEMGSFVQNLVSTLEEAQTDAQNKEASLRAMEAQIQELEGLKKQDAESQRIIASLRREIESLGQVSSPNSRPTLGSTASIQRIGSLASLQHGSESLRKLAAVANSMSNDGALGALTSNASKISRMLDSDAINRVNSAAALAQAMEGRYKK
ncbi:MAG: hypothetical protein WBF88_04345 [Pusillimonas sp.]